MIRDGLEFLFALPRVPVLGQCPFLLPLAPPRAMAVAQNMCRPSQQFYMKNIDGVPFSYCSLHNS